MDPKRIAFTNITDTTLNGIDDDTADDSPPPGSFSTTNVQVRGVDEPDIIKTDGNRVFTISGDIFSVVKVLDSGAAGKRTGNLRLPSYPREMLIEGDFVLVIGEVYNYKRPTYHRYNPERFTPLGETATVIYQVYVGGDVPKIVQTLQLEGNYLRARETKGVARIIMRFNPLNSLYLFYPLGRVTVNQTREWNREIVQFSRPESWLPTYRLFKGGRVQYGVYATCQDVFFSPTVFSGYNLLTVVTLPVDGFLSPGSSASIISNADTLYSTKISLYVTTSEFRFNDIDDNDERWGADYRTAFHKFSLSDEGASYVASAEIRGSVINQFAMHEYKNTFFIASTEGARWWASRDPSVSKVSAFIPNPSSGVLEKVGEVGNLGRDENIFAVRYVRDTGYVVTFREIDPLYVLDLSDPRNLKVLGELEVPGFSTFLHPVSPDRILGVGRDSTFSGSGAKVSLFDVSNKSNPKELSVWTLQGSYSDAEWDHRAFLYWPKERVAVMPVNVVGDGPSSFRGSIVLDITDTEIRERGRVTHNVTGFPRKPSIRRNIIIGNVHLWSMSIDILQVNNINKLADVEDQVKITN